jgi:hypothetical protein
MRSNRKTRIGTENKRSAYRQTLNYRDDGKKLIGPIIHHFAL